VRVRFYARPAAWRSTGYWIEAVVAQYGENSDQFSSSELEGVVMIGEFDLELGTPSRTELVAAEMAALRAQREAVLRKCNDELEPIDRRIQNLLALES